MASHIKLTNANGNTLSVTNNDLLAADKNVVYLDTVEQATSYVGANGDVIHISDKDRGGVFIYDSTATDNQGTVFGKCVRQYSGAVNVKWFGATGDGVTDDTLAIQAAIQNHRNIFIPEGDYLISRNTSIDGHINYGIVIDIDDTTITGVKGKSNLKRFDSNISTYALAYPLIHVGFVENSDTGTTSDIVIRDLDLYGNNTRHSTSGSTLSDLRYSIQSRASINSSFYNLSFFDIDSGAIYFTEPEYYSYVTSTTLNTGGYSEDITIRDCNFYGNSHTTTGRSLLKALSITGVNGIKITENLFSWCDSAVSGESKYDVDSINGARYSETYTKNSIQYYSSGREWVISNNVIRNSSEHSLYITGANVTINSNTINVDSTYCQGDIKLRGQFIVCSNNSIVTNNVGISIQELSRNISVSGNSIKVYGETSGGAINILSADIKTYVDNRPWFDTSIKYPECTNIVVSDNTLELEDTSFSYGYGVRLYTDAVSITGYDNGTLANVSICNNTFSNVRVGIMSIATNVNMRNVRVDSNIFSGGSFTQTGFDGSDLKGYSVLGCYLNSYYNLVEISFSNNTCKGFEYIFGILNSSGTPATGSNYHRPPRQFTSNMFEYFKDLSISVSSTTWLSFSVGGYLVQSNVGKNFIARNSMIDHQSFSNSFDYGGSSSKRGITLWDGTNLRYYYDDAGNYSNL